MLFDVEADGRLERGELRHVPFICRKKKIKPVQLEPVNNDLQAEVEMYKRLFYNEVAVRIDMEEKLKAYRVEYNYRMKLDTCKIHGPIKVYAKDLPHGDLLLIEFKNDAELREWYGYCPDIGTNGEFGKNELRLVVTDEEGHQHDVEI